MKKRKYIAQYGNQINNIPYKNDNPIKFFDVENFMPYNPNKDIKVPFKPIEEDNNLENSTKTGYREKGTGVYEYNPFFKGFNALAQGITGIADSINNSKNRKLERDRMIEALQSPVYGSTNYGNNNLIYTQYGGESKYSVPQQVEMEKGEVFTDIDNNVMKVNNFAPTHEEGGVITNNVNSVLENTSNIRNDKKSKSLKLTPNEIEEMFGVSKPKSSLSHAKAFEFVNEKFDRQRSKFIKNTEKVGKQSFPDKLTLQAVDLNLKNASLVPTDNDIFQKLFQHQEQIKEIEGIQPNETSSQFGGSFNNNSPLNKYLNLL